MSEKNKSLLTVVVVALIVSVVINLLSPRTQVVTKSQLTGGSGTPTVLDNLNLFGALQIGISDSNPLVMSGFPTGSLSLTGLISASSTLYAQQGVIAGGAISTTTPASMTLSVNDLSTTTYISMLPTVGAITVTMPASTTFSSFLTNAGDSKEFVIHNSTTTAAQSITIAGGTGTLLNNASSSAKVLPTSSADIRLTKKYNGDIIVQMIPFTP